MSQHKADKLVGVYVKMRDDLSAKTKEFKEFKATREADMLKVADALSKMMNETGQESMKTKAGTAFHATKDFITVDDWPTMLEAMVRRSVKGLAPESIEAVVKLIIESSELAIFNKSVNKTVTKDYMKDHDGMTPAGLSYGSKIEIQIRRPSK